MQVIAYYWNFEQVAKKKNTNEPLFRFNLKCQM